MPSLLNEQNGDRPLMERGRKQGKKTQKVKIMILHISWKLKISKLQADLIFHDEFNRDVFRKSL
jgi:hypothetical protein